MEASHQSRQRPLAETLDLGILPTYLPTHPPTYPSIHDEFAYSIMTVITVTTVTKGGDNHTKGQ